MTHLESRSNRRNLALAILVLFAIGCDSDPSMAMDSGGGARDAGPSTDAGPAPDVGPMTVDAGPMMVDAGPPASIAPTIMMVAWTHGGGCAPGVTTEVMFEVIVEDPDTADGDLVFTGSVMSCTGSINSSMASLTCPELATYPGSVTVRDPENNEATLSFSVAVCSDSAAP